jgi:hypothetical protein
MRSRGERYVPAMADQNPTTGDLVRAKAITSADVDALIMSYGENPGAGPLLVGTGYKLDADAAIAAHSTAPGILADPKTKAGWRRTMIKTAILMGRPEKA